MSTQEREVRFLVEKRVIPGGRWRVVAQPRNEECAFQERNRRRAIPGNDAEYRVIKESVQREVVG